MRPANGRNRYQAASDLAQEKIPVVVINLRGSGSPIFNQPSQQQLFSAHQFAELYDSESKREHLNLVSPSSILTCTISVHHPVYLDEYLQFLAVNLSGLLTTTFAPMLHISYVLSILLLLSKFSPLYALFSAPTRAF